MIIKFKLFYPFAYLMKNNFFFAGFRIGFQEIDLGIKVNQAMSMLGDVVLEDGVLKMYNPIAMISDKQIYLDWLYHQIMNKIFQLIFFWGPLTVCIAYHYYKWIKIQKEAIKKKNQYNVIKFSFFYYRIIKEMLSKLNKL